MGGGFLRSLDAASVDIEKDNANKPKLDDERENSADNERSYSDEQDSEQPEEERAHLEQEDNSARDEASVSKSARWDKLKVVKQKNKELEEQNKALYNKLLELDGYYKDTYNNNVYNYGNSAKANLDLATKSYKEAMENGSVDDIARATADYTFALNEFQNASRIVNDNTAYNERQTGQSQEPSQVDNNRDNNHLHSQWLRENPELDENSRYYDPNLAKKVIKEANKLNEYLESKGMTHFIGSRDYLDKLDEYIEYYGNKSPGNNLQGYGVHSPNNMREKTHNYNLSEVEKKIAAAQNMTAKEYRDSQARMPERLRLKQQMLKG